MHFSFFEFKISGEGHPGNPGTEKFRTYSFFLLLSLEGMHLLPFEGDNLIDWNLHFRYAFLKAQFDVDCFLLDFR
jgi:hypothetical protein